MDRGRTAGAPGAVPAAALERSSSPPLGRTDPLCEGRFSLVPDNDVPSGIRAGVDPSPRSWRRCGFVPAGFMAGIELLPELPRHYALLSIPAKPPRRPPPSAWSSPPSGPASTSSRCSRTGAGSSTVRARRHLFLADFTSGRLVEAPRSRPPPSSGTRTATLLSRQRQRRPTRRRRRARAAPRSLADLLRFQGGARQRGARARRRGKPPPSPPTIRAGSGSRPAGASRFMARTRSRGRRRRPRCPDDVTYLRIPVEEQERLLPPEPRG